jgi:hypothetical protein
MDFFGRDFKLNIYAFTFAASALYMLDLKLEANLPDPEYGSCLSGEIGVPALSDVARINSELLLILKSNRSSRLRKLVLFRLISLLI